MMTVKFTNVEEFVSELTKDAAKVERGIVRLVFRTSYDTGVAYVEVMTLVVSAIVDGKVVRLERRCGSFWRDTEDQKKVAEFAERQADVVRVACAEMRLEIRSGVFEPSEK